MVLLVVDIQNKLMKKQLYKFEDFVQNITTLVSAARQKNTEVIYIRHNNDSEFTPEMEGFQIFSQLRPKGKEKIFDKNFSSAFKNTGLIEYLNEKKENQIMIVGLLTDYCIDATIKCGFEHGFKMIVPAFCNTTENNNFMTSEQSYKYYNQYMWNERYASCISFEEALDML